MSEQSATSDPYTDDDRKTEQASKESEADDMLVHGPHEEECHVGNEHTDTSTAKISLTVTTISESDIMGSIAATSCKGVYTNADILQTGKELYIKYGHLDFHADEIANLIEKKLSMQDQSSHSCTGLILMSDLGHNEDGEHLIMLSKCDRCASKGKTPNVKWV